MPHSLRPVPEEEDLRICELTGRLDAYEAIALRAALNGLLEEMVTKLVVACSSLELITAAGISALLEYAQQAREQLGDICFVGVTPDLRRVMDIAGFSQYFAFYDDEQAAIKSLTAESKPRKSKTRKSRSRK